MALLIRRVLLIANPASRRGRVLAARAQKAFQRAGVAAELRLTERPGHAGELARDHGASVDAVFSLGGDGTAMEIAGALAGTGTPIGVLPGGTGNLLARAIGIPRRIQTAVPALLGGDLQRIDLGELPEGRRFAVAAGTGIDTAMVAETPRWLKRRLGVLAYALIAVRAGLRAVWRRDFFRVRLTVDGGPVEERVVAAVIVANFGAVLEERITFGPGIHCDDGVLDACLFSPRTLRDAVRIMWRILRRDFSTDACMFYRSGRHIRIETDPPRMFQADGELLGSTPVELGVLPLAATLLVPAR